MRKFAAAVVIALALTGCAAGEPEARSAPVGVANVPSASADAQPTVQPSTEPDESAHPAADEDRFLEYVAEHWTGEGMPDDDELLAAGYRLCDELTAERAFDPDLEPEWSQSNNLIVHVAATARICPAP